MNLCLSPNDVTITNLIAGGEYNIHMLAESAFGRNSSQLSIVRSLYTDDVTVSNAITTHSLQTNVEFDSGVGSTVEMDLRCLDLPLSWRDRKAFAWVHSELEELETLSGQTSVRNSLEKLVDRLILQIKSLTIRIIRWVRVEFWSKNNVKLAVNGGENNFFHRIAPSSFSVECSKFLRWRFAVFSSENLLFNPFTGFFTKKNLPCRIWSLSPPEKQRLLIPLCHLSLSSKMFPVNLR